MGEKVGFTNCVFEKLCVCVCLFVFFFFSESTIFIVFSAKHSFSKAKMVCWKKTKNLWKIVGCFFEVLKNACFPRFLAFCGVVYSCLFGVWKVQVFSCFLCLFLFFVLLLFLFCLLCFCFVVGLFFGVGSCFAFVFVFFLFLFFVFVFVFFLICFFGGFKGQVRWPKGPPHLALNPPYFLFLFFFVFVVLFFWRV